MSGAAMQYEPHPSALHRLVGDLGCRRVLLVGEANPPEVDAAEVKSAAMPPQPLTSGLYAFHLAGGFDVMVVTGGHPPAAADSAGPDADDSHPLRVMHQWFDFLWQGAKPVAGAARVAVGDWVSIVGSGEVGLIERVERRAGLNVFVVRDRGFTRELTEDGIGPVIREEHPLEWLAHPAPSAERFAVGLTVLKLANPLTDTVYSYLSSKTVFRAYQFRPVLKLTASSQQRLLIADEVGLGKTIEAGLIWSELEARNPQLNRALVVCPSALVRKWQDEMSRRFDRELELLDAAAIERWIKVMGEGDDTKSLVGVISLERLRREATLRRLTDANPTFDLVIVDEAHYLRNTATQSYQAGALLADWADALVFLSATPLNLGTHDLFNLMNLLNASDYPDAVVFGSQLEPNRRLNEIAQSLFEWRHRPVRLAKALETVSESHFGAIAARRPEFKDLHALLDTEIPLDAAALAEARRLLLELNTLSSTFTRTRKVDLHEQKAVREPVQVDVEWTEAELDFYVAIVALLRMRAKSSGLPPGFAMQMPLRQAASCLPAMVQYLRDRGHLASRTALQAIRPADDHEWDEWDESAEREADDAWLDDPSADTSLEVLIARLGNVDTKFDQFEDYLGQARAAGGRQVLVFSFFRRTLEYLSDRLLDLGISHRTMHGGVPVEMRQRIMDEFRRGDFEVLLSSEVGAEGLDFEFCNVVVNYDLPWNPMRVEQRIGRLDRFGQEHEKIFVINFHVPGTIETEIFLQLYHRIGVFERSIGELEPILRDGFAEAAEVALDPELTDEQRQRRADEMWVALEKRRVDLSTLDESRSMLAGIDGLLIDGFEEMKSRGRFVGPPELRSLLVQFAKASGARGFGGTPSLDGVVTFVGSEGLEAQVRRSGNQRIGTKYSIGHLARLLADEEPLDVTFSNEVASRRDVELISLRHPLVRAAVSYFEDRPDGIARFASLSVPATEAVGRWLIGLHVATTTGVRPQLEIWPVAVELDSLRVDETVGDLLLGALTKGELGDGPAFDSAELAAAYEVMVGEASRMQHEVEAKRRASNVALAEARIASQEAMFRYKIERVEQMLREGKGIEAIHRARVRNLEEQRGAAVDGLEARKVLAMTLRLEAMAAVTFVGGGQQ